MRRTIDFLRVIWPDDGFYALAAINRHKHVLHQFLPTLDEAAIEAFVQDHLQKHDDIYMAVGSFADQRRLKVTAKSFRSFFLDIDVGQKTPYPSINEAILALQHFCSETGLPVPSALVKSGGGLHAYWSTNETLPPPLWEALSRALIALLPDSPLFIKDPGISADAARILRLPGTFNHKELTLRPVEVLFLGQRYPLKRLLDVLGTPAAPTQAPVLPPLHVASGDLGLTATLAAIGSKPKSFRTIMERCTQNTGCEQLTQSLRYRAEETEPLWRATLSIAKYCEDGAEAIHVVSKAHPSYNRFETEQKAALILGPYTCQTFDTLRPGFCGQCPHYKKISSPIQLGDTRELAEAPREAPMPTSGSSPITFLLSGEPITEELLPTPFPYVIDSEGATYRALDDRSSKEALKQGLTLVQIGNQPAVKAYSGHIILVGRAYDTESNDELLHVRWKLGKQPYRFGTVPSKDVGSADMLRKVFMGGAIMNNNDASFVQAFLRSAQRADAKEREPAPLLHKYGWHNRNTDFIYGNYRLKADGTISNAIMRNTEGFAAEAALRVAGNPQHWVKMADYWNREEHNDMAFTLLSAFGAPLMPLMNVGVAGSLLHLFTPDSGYGKSALQTMIAAAYGNPQELMFTPQDTVNALLHRVGVLSNLPICIDEVTNLPAERLSDLVYQVTQGREKLRMRQDYKGNTKPSGDWCTTVITSGNASITDKLFALKASPEGELMRFLELRPTARLSGPTPLASVIDGVDKNFGGVGALYLYYVITHKAEVLTIISQVRARLQADKILGEAQRFWLALLTCNLAGGLIAQSLGFIRYDMTALEQWSLEFINRRAHDIGQRKQKPQNVFHDFIGRLTPNMVVAAAQGAVVAAKMHPLARIDYSKGLLSISMSAITQEAHRYQVAVYDLMGGLQSTLYSYLQTIDVRITDGLPSNMFTPVVLQCAQFSFDPSAVTSQLNTGLPDNVVSLRQPK